MKKRNYLWQETAKNESCYCFCIIHRKHDTDAGHGALHGLGPADRPFAVYDSWTQGAESAGHVRRQRHQRAFLEQLGFHQGLAHSHRGNAHHRPYHGRLENLRNNHYFCLLRNESNRSAALPYNCVSFVVPPQLRAGDILWRSRNGRRNLHGARKKRRG